MTNIEPGAGLERLVGEWTMTAVFAGQPPAHGGTVTFEWLPGREFLIQRWEVPVPEAPDGVAIIGTDAGRDGGYLQHYFDSRGVARLYKMTIDDGAWHLWRDEADFSPLDFHQRYRGTFDDAGTTITGAWEIASDGATWEHDFELRYHKI